MPPKLARKAAETDGAAAVTAPPKTQTDLPTEPAAPLIVHRIAAKEMPSYTVAELGKALTALAPALDKEGVANAAPLIAQGLAQATAPNARAELSKVLQELINLLDVQGMINVLKCPFCVGQARMIVLRHLGKHKDVGQQFGDLWDMVAWMRQNKPEIDLTSPPQRPDILDKQ
jgi:hypothetical protein